MLREKTESKVDDQLVPFAVEIGKVLIVIFGVLIVLSNVFDVDVTALAAGLGVGGIAIAMASKESLENLSQALGPLMKKCGIL